MKYVILLKDAIWCETKQNNTRRKILNKTLVFQRNFNKNLGYRVVVFYFDHRIDVRRQSGGRVIHEIRCVALQGGRRIGLSTENQVRREKGRIDALLLQGEWHDSQKRHR